MRSTESILHERYGDAYKEIIRKEYVVNGVTLEKIGEKYSVSRNAVKRILVNMGVEIVSQSEMMKRWWEACQGEDRKKMVAAAHAKNRELAEKGELSFQRVWREDRGRMTEHARKNALKMCRNRKRNGMTGRTGPKHHHWDPTRAKENRIKFRKTEEHYAWVRAVYEKDGFICQACGYDKGGTLNAHHLYSYADFEELRHEVSNGITLCKECHVSFHDVYGYGRNTAEQFSEYRQTQEQS